MDITRGSNASRARRNSTTRSLQGELVRLHEKYPTMGLDGLYQAVKQIIPCSRGQVHRLMKRINIHSVRRKAYKITTDSNILWRQICSNRNST